MTAGLASIAPRLVKLLPMLASDQSGEVAATAAVITRTLAGAGMDWHMLASLVVAQVERA